MTGSRMQTLAIIILALSSVVVAAFDLRELFIAGTRNIHKADRNELDDGSCPNANCVLQYPSQCS